MTPERVLDNQLPNSDSVLKQLAHILVLAQVAWSDVGPVPMLGLDEASWEKLRQFYTEATETYIVSNRAEIFEEAIEQGWADIGELLFQEEASQVRGKQRQAQRADTRVALLKAWLEFLAQVSQFPSTKA